ncbi:MAG: hypothetical protein SWQ30_04390 [Thermodesulfobacteriota bacterium]|nr:hypothetical protein [Thermodesulfobacteriota bacterium]
MTGLRLIGIVSLSVVLAGFSGAIVHAEYHHVDDCSVCHYRDCNDCTNEIFLRCEIDTPNSGIKDVTFTGPDSYVRGESPYNGVCEVCHTATDYHTNTGDGTTHFDGVNCIPCHPHKTDPDLFSPLAVVGLESHETHMSDNRGPGAGGCMVCHLDTENYSLFADGHPLATTSACDTCHSPGGAFDGRDMAKANWEAGIYGAGGGAFQPDKEQWCSSCHDDDPANSKSDGSGVDAPNVIGDNATYGFYVTGHKMNCLNCHDAAKTHIDHTHRSFEVDESEGVWAYPYGEGYRLQISSNWQYAANRFCYFCHESTELYDETKTNLLRGDNGQSSHALHLDVVHSTNGVDSDFDGIGDINREGCTCCHNVHGSSTKTMTRNGDLTNGDLEFAYLVSNPPDATATWTPDLAGGSYGVYAWWKAEENRATDAPYTVYYNGGDETVVVNQKINGSQWNKLGGPYSFAAGLSGYVMLANNANNYVIADAVGWDTDLDGTPDVIVDNTEVESFEITGDWGTSPTGGYNGDYRWHADAGSYRDPNQEVVGSHGGSVNIPNRISGNGICDNCHVGGGAYEWKRVPYLGPRVLMPAPEDLFVSNSGSGSTTITVTILDHDTACGDIDVDIDDGGWQDMTHEGACIFSYEATVPAGTNPGKLAYDIRAVGDGDTGVNTVLLYVYDDNAVIVDTKDIEWTGTVCPFDVLSSDFDWMYLDKREDGYGSDFAWARQEGTLKATWRPAITTAGNYEVFAWWIEHELRASNAPYTIHYSGGEITVTVDQRDNGSQWNKLPGGPYPFAAGTNGYVELTNNADGYVTADAIMLMLAP